MLSLLVCALLVWVPGTALGLALRLPLRWAVLVAPGLSAAVVGVGAALGLPWGVWAATGVWAVALVGALALAGRRGGRGAAAVPARAPESAPAPVLARPPLVLAGAGVVLASCLLAATMARAGFTASGVNQLWDAAWHANLTTWVLETGDAAPSAAGRLLGAGWRVVGSSYPTGLHATAALVVALGGGSVIEALHAVLAVHAVVVLPAAVAAVVWEVARGQRAGQPPGQPPPGQPPAGQPPAGQTWAAGLGAGVAAIVSVLPEVFPLDHWWRPAWPTTVSFTLAVLTVAAALRCAHGAREGSLSRRTAIAVPVLCLTGATAVHPSAAVVVALVLGAWALGEVAALRGRRRVVGLSVAVGAAALASLGARVASERVPALVSLFGAGTRTDLSPVAAVTRVLGLSVPVAASTGYGAGDRGPQTLLAVGLLVALAVVLGAHRAPGAPGVHWLGLLWVLLVLAAAETLAPVAAPLRVVTGFFFNGQARMEAVVVLLGAVMAGVAVTVVAPVLARRRWTAVAGSLALAVVLGGTASDTARRAGPRVRAAYTDRVVGPDQQEVMRALAALPLPRGGRVLADPLDGSPWLYALTGTMPMFTHYDAHDPTADAALLLARLHDVDTDPAVRAALTRLRVCFVYVGGALVSARQQPAVGFTGLDGATSLTLVARTGSARAYRVLPPVAGC